jgi:hypothetical protein
MYNYKLNGLLNIKPLNIFIITEILKCEILIYSHTKLALDYSFHAYGFVGDILTLDIKEKWNINKFDAGPQLFARDPPGDAVSPPPSPLPPTGHPPVESCDSPPPPLTTTYCYFSGTDKTIKLITITIIK